MKKSLHLNKTTFKKKGIPLIWSIVRFILLAGFSYTILYPLMTKMTLVFMDRQDLSDFSVKWIPKHFTLENISISLEVLDYWNTLLKTIGICLVVSILQIAVCTLAAYGFARFKSKLRTLIFGLVIATLLIPPHTYIVTLYTQFQHFDILGIVSFFNGEGINLLDSAWTFVILAATGMGIRSGLYIYVEKQTFSALPAELEEAAEVDGAGMFRTFYSIMLPNAIPSIVMCTILSFVWQWNDTFYVNYLASGMELLSGKIVGMHSEIGHFLGDWNLRGTQYVQLLMSAGTLLCVLPLIIIFIACQRFFVQGVERSGLVG